MFRDRGRVGERGREKDPCVVAFHTPPTGDLACNPGMCPDWESNLYPLVCRPTLNPLSYTARAQLTFIKVVIKVLSLGNKKIK